ncbi:eukaryotic translation initiation factor 3G1, partial [Striga asiatica]
MTSTLLPELSEGLRGAEKVLDFAIRYWKRRHEKRGRGERDNNPKAQKFQGRGGLRDRDHSGFNVHEFDKFFSLRSRLRGLTQERKIEINTYTRFRELQLIAPPRLVVVDVKIDQTFRSNFSGHLHRRPPLPASRRKSTPPSMIVAPHLPSTCPRRSPMSQSAQEKESRVCTHMRSSPRRPRTSALHVPEPPASVRVCPHDRAPSPTIFFVECHRVSLRSQNPVRRCSLLRVAQHHSRRTSPPSGDPSNEHVAPHTFTGSHCLLPRGRRFTGDNLDEQTDEGRGQRRERCPCDYSTTSSPADSSRSQQSTRSPINSPQSLVPSSNVNIDVPGVKQCLIERMKCSSRQKRYKLHMHYKKFASTQDAKANKPAFCPSQETWEQLCDHFANAHYK